MSNAAELQATLLQQHAQAQRTIITPEAVPIRVELAERSERLGAALLDLLFIQLTLGLFVISLMLMAWASGFVLAELYLVIYFVGNFLLLNFWFVVFELRWNGQTPGKRIVKIRVIDSRGGPLTGRAVMARNVLRNLELFLPLSLIGGASADPVEAWQKIFLWLWLGAMLSLPFINRDRMRGGDLAAGTWVVTAPKPQLLADVATAARKTETQFSRAQLQAYGIYELQTLETVLRDYRDDVMAEVAQRIAQKIGQSGPVANPSAFLQDFYAALRQHLESGLLMGKRKADKFDKNGS
jgi:uncharacterized RDD family membrane protein YckC